MHTHSCQCSLVYVCVPRSCAVLQALQLRLKTLSDSSTDEDDMRASASETEAEAQEEGEVLMEEETEEVVEVVPELTGPEMRELILSKVSLNNKTACRTRM